MDEFEALLKEFTPRQPGPLPHPAKGRPALWLLGAAAVAAAAVGVTVVVQDFGPGRRSVVAPGARMPLPTIGALTPLALSDPAALDAALDRMSQTLLPDVEQPDRALSALAR